MTFRPGKGNIRASTSPVALFFVGNWQIGSEYTYFIQLALRLTF
jgi:hypothetical protein